MYRPRVRGFEKSKYYGTTRKHVREVLVSLSAESVIARGSYGSRSLIQAGNHEHGIDDSFKIEQN